MRSELNTLSDANQAQLTQLARKIMNKITKKKTNLKKGKKSVTLIKAGGKKVDICISKKQCKQLGPRACSPVMPQCHQILDQVSDKLSLDVCQLVVRQQPQAVNTSQPASQKIGLIEYLSAVYSIFFFIIKCLVIPICQIIMFLSLQLFN